MYYNSVTFIVIVIRLMVLYKYKQRANQMKLTQTEIQFLNDQMNDLYYALNVEEMTTEGQKIFKNLQNKIAKEAK